MEIKEMIFGAVRDQFKEYNLTSLIIEYDLITDKTFLTFTDNEGKKETQENLDKKRILEKVFIKKMSKEIDGTLIKLMIYLEFENEKFQVFYKVENNNTLFEFKTNEQ
jgi:hypothetical protein